MKIGIFYKVQSGMIKDTKYGQKVALIIIDDLKEYLLYIGDYVTNKSKLNAILELLEDDEIMLFISVESYEERSANSSITNFDYMVVEKNKVIDNNNNIDIDPAPEDGQKQEIDMTFEEVEILEESEQNVRV